MPGSHYVPATHCQKGSKPADLVLLKSNATIGDSARGGQELGLAFILLNLFCVFSVCLYSELGFLFLGFACRCQMCGLLGPSL